MQAISAVDAGMKKVLVDSNNYDITVSTLRKISIAEERKGVLSRKEEEELVEFILKMAMVGHPTTLLELMLKVAEITYYREMPFKYGIPGHRWVKWFTKRQPTPPLRVAQELEASRAKGLLLVNMKILYANLLMAY